MILAHSGEVRAGAIDLARTTLGVTTALSRHYSSVLQRDGAAGWGWSLGHETFIEALPGGAGARLVAADGTESLFWSAGGGPDASAGTHRSLDTRTDQSGNPLYAIVDPLGGEIEFGWDGAMRRTRTRHGVETELVYDGWSRVVRIEPQGSGPWQLFYRPASGHASLHGRLHRIQDDLGRDAIFHHSSAQSPGRHVAPEWTWATPSSNTTTLLVGIEGPDAGTPLNRRQSWAYRYDAQARLHQVIDPEQKLHVRLDYRASGMAHGESVRGPGNTRRRSELRHAARRLDGIVAEVTRPGGHQDRLDLRLSPQADVGLPRVADIDGEARPGVQHRLVSRASANRDGLYTSVTRPDGRLMRRFFMSTDPDPRRRANLRFVEWRPSSAGMSARYMSLEYRSNENRPKTVIGPNGWTSTNPPDHRVTRSYTATMDLQEEILPRVRDLGTLLRPSSGLNAAAAWTYMVANPVRQWRYNAHGQITRAIDEDGYATEYQYDGRGYLLAVVADASPAEPARALTDRSPPEHLVTTVTPGPLGTVDAVTTPTGVTSLSRRDRLGRTWATQTLSHGTAFEQSVVRDIWGRTVTTHEIEHNPAGFGAMTLAPPIGMPTGGKLSEVRGRDPLGMPDEVAGWFEPNRAPVVRNATFDASGWLEETEVGGITNAVVRTGTGLAADVNTPKNRTSTIDYDLGGRVRTTVTAAGARTDRFYDGHGRLEAVVDPMGDITRMRYAEDGSWVEESRHDGRSHGNGMQRKPDLAAAHLVARTTRTYDLLGNLVRVDRWRFPPDPSGGTGPTATVPGPVGAPAGLALLPDGELTPGDGAVTTIFTYDRRGNRTQVLSDDLGREIVFYDGLRRLIHARQQLPVGRVASPAHNTPTSRWRWANRGQVVDAQYDAAGRLLSQRVTHKQDPGSPVPETVITTTIRYTSLDRPAAVTVSGGNLSRTTRYEYDDAARTRTTIDPKGLRRVEVFSPKGTLAETRLEAPSASPGGVPSILVRTRYGRDSLGRMQWVEHGGARQFHRHWDPVDGLLEREVYADGSFSRYQWDQGGRLEVKTDRDRAELRFVINDGGEVEQLWLDATGGRSATVGQVQEFRYDPLGRATFGADRPNATEIERTFDSLGTLLRETQRVGADATDVDYQWAGRIRRVSYRGGVPGGWLEREVDGLGRLRFAREGNGVEMSRYSWTGGLLGSVTMPELHRVYSRNGLGEPVHMAFTTFGLPNAAGVRSPVVNGGLDEGWDAAGLRNNVAWTFGTGPTAAPKIETRLQHDLRGRQTDFEQDIWYGPVRATSPDESLREARDYDARSNIAAISRSGGPPEVHTVDDADVVKTITGRVVDDRAGRMTTLDDHEYRWDHLGRLLEVVDRTTGRVVTRHRYGPFGRILEKTGDGATHREVFDGIHGIERWDVQQGLASVYQYGPGADRPERMWLPPSEPPGPRTYLGDAIGHLGCVLDPSGDIGELTSYAGFGFPTFRDKTGSARVASAYKLPLAFGARPFDEAAGLYEHRARYFNPSLGRWANLDPKGFDAGWNLHTAMGGAPWSARDPLGRDHTGQHEDCEKCAEYWAGTGDGEFYINRYRRYRNYTSEHGTSGGTGWTPPPQVEEEEEFSWANTYADEVLTGLPTGYMYGCMCVVDSLTLGWWTNLRRVKAQKAHEWGFAGTTAGEFGELMGDVASTATFTAVGLKVAGAGQIPLRAGPALVTFELANNPIVVGEAAVFITSLGLQSQHKDASEAVRDATAAAAFGGAVLRGVGLVAAALRRWRLASRLQNQRGPLGDGPYKLNIGGSGTETGVDDFINVNPIQPSTGGPARPHGVPNLLQIRGEQIREYFGPSSVGEIRSFSLPAEAVSWPSFAGSASEVMVPGGSLQMGMQPGGIPFGVQQEITRAFAEAGFTDIQWISDVLIRAKAP